MQQSTLIEQAESHAVERTDSPVLLVFSDDWGRHPSSCQHLVAPLLNEYRVIWVNTIGMRPPRLDWSTVTRGFEKLKGWSSKEEHSSDLLPENLTVLQPVMWPWMKRGIDRAFNQRLLNRQLKKHLASIEGPVTAITTVPIVADLMESLPVDRWVYYCVDDFSHWPGLEQQTLGTLEQKVIEKADVLIAAGTHLQQRLAAFRDEVHLLKHGLDLTLWDRVGKSGESQLLDNSAGPHITFWGLIDRRMDLSFVQRLSQSLDKGTINLIGPQDQPHSELMNLANVKLHEPVEYQQLPGVAEQSDLLIMPYEDAAVTRAMQPLKLLEYLATGLPVVARDLPANREWADCLDLADTADSFVEIVLERLRSGVLDAQKIARKRLKNESWSAKSKTFERLIVPVESSRFDLSSFE